MAVNRLGELKRLGIPQGPKNKSQLTLDEIKAEVRKLTEVQNYTGFLYFLLEYVIVSHPSRGAVKLSNEMYAWQAKAALEFLQGRYFISKKVRQVGFSTIVGAYALWRALFFQSQAIVIISLSQRESTTFLKKRVKFPYDNLPDWLRQSTAELAKTTISFEHNGSTVTALPNTEDPGRSDSLSLLIVDEFAAMKNQKDLLAAAVPTLSAGAHTTFTSSSLPSQMFIISTLPRKHIIDNEYLRILHEAQDGLESKYKVVDVDVTDIPCHADPEWHKEQRETLGDRIYKIEVLGIEAYEMEEALLPSHVLELLIAEDPIRCDFLFPEDVDEMGYYKEHERLLEMKDDYDEKYNYIKNLWIWNEPEDGRQYVVVCDVASGRANDWSTALVFDPEDNSQVAEYRGKVDTERFKAIVLKICERYNDAKLSIESSGLGGPVVEWFATTLMYQHLYWHKKSKREYNPGFPMSMPNRANGIALMQTNMVKGEYKVKSIRLINELRTFGYTKAGRIEGLGGNDDLVMTLVQYTYLQNIGWAVTDRMMRAALSMGSAEEEAAPEPGTEPIIKVKKYWQRNFDVDLTEDTADILAMADALGCSVVDANVARRLGWDDDEDHLRF